MLDASPNGQTSRPRLVVGTEQPSAHSPLADPHTPPLPNPVQLKPAFDDASLSPGCEILVLEDDVPLRKRLAAYLRQLGAEVTEAEQARRCPPPAPRPPV